MTGASAPAATTKVAVVGAGSVGATIAYACMIRGIGRTIALYDINAAKTGPRCSTSTTASSSSRWRRSKAPTTSRSARTPTWS